MTVRIGCFTIALALIAHPSFAAAPGDPVSTFVQLCGETHGDEKAALARADALGWATPSKPVGPAMIIDPHRAAVRPQGRVKIGTSETWSLLVGPTGNPRYRDCAVGATLHPGAVPFDLAAMRRELQTWTGTAPLPNRDRPDYVVFAFAERPNGHARLPNSYDPLGNNAPERDGTAMVTFQTFKGVAMMIYRTPAS